MSDRPNSKNWTTVAVVVGGAMVLALCLPTPEPAAGTFTLGGATRAPFIWGQDSLWMALEHQFARSGPGDCDSIGGALSSSMSGVRKLLRTIRSRERSPADPVFAQLETRFFHTTPAVARCPEFFPEFLRLAEESRQAIKERSLHWNMNDSVARVVMYRSLYGTRAAIEEIMLQMPPGSIPDLVEGIQEPSSTPEMTILGVRIHSGDILVSRGGAPTSALIARGNDFPGNFSHVALVHVDSTTRKASLIEAHIERGVAVATVDEYLKDTKLRIMVLRLRADHPALQSDPLLPHRAAQVALDDARTRHIPYDFEMRYDEPTQLFCSEVASAAYGSCGVHLWMGTSTISDPGLRSWLGAFGVRYFVTQEPSDLEYDPQLNVVAEWRDPETLYQDHADNAVTEAMLEGSQRGEKLRFDWYLLPVGRIMKWYSAVLNAFGEVGPVPEGMSAEAALRNRWYSERHAAARALVMAKADAFVTSKGYRPPYWRLLEMARAAL